MNNDKNFNDMIDFINNTTKTNKVKKKKTNKFLLLIINFLSISLLVGGGVGLKILYDKAKDYDNTKNMEEELIELYYENEEETELIDVPEEEQRDDNYQNKSMQELLNINPDTVGWLKVNNTNIDMPIVQGTNNAYYLTHNFREEYSAIGWLFADYRNQFNNTLSKNTIIYGHTFRNGSNLMMSTLKYVLNDSWQNNSSNYTITFNTVNKNMKWQVFSIYTIPVTDDYLRVNFNNGNDFKEFADQLKNRSMRDYGIDVNPDDYILTLSTCHNNTDNRLVLHAKLITE